MSCFRRAATAAAVAALLSACSARASAPPFALTDDRGNAWSLRAQRGHPVVLTFGFTHCADTCPATLAKLASIAASTKARGIEPEIAFVTVDPRRDGVVALHAFVSRFAKNGADIVGLTGTPAQIDAVETTYHVWAQRVPGRRGSTDYDVAHSAVIYFIDGNGRIAALADDGDPDAVLTRAVVEAAS